MQMIQTRQGQYENADIGEDVRQADIAVARDDVGAVAVNGLVPLIFEGLADGERRDDVGDCVGYGDPNHNPRPHPHISSGEYPQVQDQNRKLGAQTGHHVHKLGCCLQLKICRDDGRIGEKPVRHVTAGTA